MSLAASPLIIHSYFSLFIFCFSLPLCLRVSVFFQKAFRMDNSQFTGPYSAQFSRSRILGAASRLLIAVMSVAFCHRTVQLHGEGSDCKTV